MTANLRCHQLSSPRRRLTRRARPLETGALAAHGSGLRQVSRHPLRVNPGDEMFPADLLDGKATAEAVAGGDVAYLVAGLRYDASVWIASTAVISTKENKRMGPPSRRSSAKRSHSILPASLRKPRRKRSPEVEES